SPLPLLRKLTEEGQTAQEVIDLLENHGALYVDHHYEVSPHVALSIDRLRTELRGLTKRIKYDSELKGLIKDLADECRSFMNCTGNNHGHSRHELETLRRRVGVIVLRFREDYGCKIRGDLNRILP
ncbi:MAG: hypothetical protein JNN20_19600, partial [Betaproteobacteria bacterium]|nr:hypothetical protein [Betaproteobacteria bacterium]